VWLQMVGGGGGYVGAEIGRSSGSCLPTLRPKVEALTEQGRFTGSNRFQTALSSPPAGSLLVSEPVPKNVGRIDDVVVSFADLPVAVRVYLTYGIPCRESSS
jgi:hypothetical protein